MNPSTLSGAIDIIVVRQKNGDLMSSPFHVRFGKLKLLNPSDKIVELTVNGNLVDINMKVGEAGEAFFVIETCNQVPSEYATSPIVLAVNAEDAPEIEPFQLGEDPLENLEIVQEDSPTSKHNNILDDENVVINVDPMLNETLKPNHEEFETDKVGIKIPGVKYEQDLAVDKKMPPNSPPWVWAWGGLPERSKEPTIETEKEHSLNRMVSSPVMGINSQVVPSGTISHEEKVGKYLAELPVYKGTKRIAIDESLDDTSIHNILNGAPVTFNNKLKLSSCGPLSEFQKLDADKAKLKFEEKIIDYQHFCDNPNLLTSPEMLFMVNGFYHSWETAAPIIMAQVLFQQPLSVPGAKKILQRKQSRWSTWWAGDKPKNTDVPPKLENTKSDLKTKASEPIMRYSIVRSESSTVGRPHSPATIEEVQYAKSLRLNSDQLVL